MRLPLDRERDLLRSLLLLLLLLLLRFRALLLLRHLLLLECCLADGDLPRPSLLCLSDALLLLLDARLVVPGAT